MRQMATMFPNQNALKSISGLQRWFIGSNATVESGGRVVTWTDLSGNGRNYTQTTGSSARPTQTANLCNGKPAIVFDGMDDYLDGGTNKDLVNTAAYTIAIIVNRAAFPGTSNFYEQMLNIRTDSASFCVNLIFLNMYAAYSSKELMCAFGGSTLMGTAAFTSASTNYPVFQTFNGGTRTTVGNYALNANNSAQTLSSTTTWTVSDTNNIGRYPGGGGSGYYNGNIAFLAYWNKNLSAAEKAILQNYVQMNWNLKI